MTHWPTSIMINGFDSEVIKMFHSITSECVLKKNSAWMKKLREGNLVWSTQEDKEWQEILMKSHQPKAVIKTPVKPAVTEKAEKMLAITYSPSISLTYTGATSPEIKNLNDRLTYKITAEISAHLRKPLISLADKLYKSRVTSYTTLSQDEQALKAHEAAQAIRIFFYLDTGIDLENIQHKSAHVSKTITFEYCDKFMNLLNDTYYNNEGVQNAIWEEDDPFYVFQHKNLFTLITSVYSTEPELLKERLAVSKVDLKALERRNRQRIELNMNSYRLRTGYDEYTDTYQKQTPADSVMQEYLNKLSSTIDARYLEVGDLVREEEVLEHSIAWVPMYSTEKEVDKTLQANHVQALDEACDICKVSMKPKLDEFDAITKNMYILTETELFYFDYNRKELTELQFSDGKNLELLKVTLDFNGAEYQAQPASEHDRKQITYYTGHSHENAVSTFKPRMS